MSLQCARTQNINNYRPGADGVLGRVPVWSVRTSTRPHDTATQETVSNFHTRRPLEREISLMWKENKR